MLLGDPLTGWQASSDMYAASVVEKQVLVNGRQALLCYGGGHLLHPASKLTQAPSNLAGIIEQRTGERIYAISDLVPFAGDPGGLASKLSRYPRDSPGISARPGRTRPSTSTPPTGKNCSGATPSWANP